MRVLAPPPVRVMSPAPRAAWHHVAHSDPQTLVTQTPLWTDALCATGRWEDASRLYTTPSGRQLVMPMVRALGLGGRLGIESSLPAHWGFGGLLAPSGVEPADVEAVLSNLSTRPVLRQRIRPNPLQNKIWDASHPELLRIPRRAHVLSLHEGADAVFRGFRSNARRAVRTAERRGVTVEHDDTGRLLPEFFGLLELSRARWSAQMHEPEWLARRRQEHIDSLAKWQRIATLLGGGCNLWLARVDGTPAAGIIVLTGSNAHYTRGAMDKNLAGPTYANFALHWHAIQFACATGAHSYHMGESGNSASMARYKEQFGARPYDYPELRLERVPITRADQLLRTAVKRVIGFKEPQ